MVVAPAGSFLMGSPDGEPERESCESPQHEVTITRPFAVSRHAISRGQFAAFITNTGYKIDPPGPVWKGEKWDVGQNVTWRNPGFVQDDSHPVVCVGWDDAKAYAAWLTRQTRQAYRLPTETEWEYVARAGTTISGGARR
jgi:formylglycine-generating enzyme required for sulfatase activity